MGIMGVRSWLRDHPWLGDPSMSEPIDRRHFLGLATAAGLAAGLSDSTGEAGPERAATAPPRPPRPYLTEPADFYDVSRGNPKPFTLKGEALVKARLTPETWRLEIVSDGSAN